MKPPNEKLALLAHQWLEKASKDLGVTKLLAAQGDKYRDFACFHAQQCVEKTLKAFLVWKEVEFRKTHNLLALGSMCESKDPTLKETAKIASELSKYAVDARYPGEANETYTEEETVKALKTAETVLAEIKRKIP